MIMNKITGKFTLMMTILVGSFFLFSCGQSSVDETNQQLTIIHGKVLSLEENIDQGQVISNASVVVTKIHSNGVVENISHEPTYTDEQGEFIIKTASGGAENLVIVAKLNGRQWKGITEDTLDDKDEIIEVTLTDETTIETEVFNRIRTIQNYHDVRLSDIQKRVTPKIALEVKGNVVAIAKLAETIYQEITSSDQENVTEISGAKISLTDSQIYSVRNISFICDMVSNQYPLENAKVHPSYKHKNFQKDIDRHKLVVRRAIFNSLLSYDEKLTQQLSDQTEKRVLLQVKGDVPMSDRARQILENLMGMFGTYRENESISVEILKENNVVHLHDSIDGNLSYYQQSIYEKLKRQIKTDFKLLEKDNIQLQVKVNIYESSQKSYESNKV